MIAGNDARSDPAIKKIKHDKIIIEPPPFESFILHHHYITI